ncbi:MAG: hypothetical protein ACT4OP_06840 [Actinomycetota bacterium]
MRLSILRLATPVVGLVLAACGAQGSPVDTSTTIAGAEGGPVANACPPEGCEITIVDAARDGEELRLTWEANFLPDVSRNHIHVYWDIYTADQVSSDAEARGVEQGEWHPTDAYPEYVTTDTAVSVANRGESSMICVTAGDRDHAVIDSTIVNCRDVSSLLDG